MSNHHTLNYVEFAASDLTATKAFFQHVFKWQFTDYGPQYTAFSCESAGLDGGFYQAPLKCLSTNGGALLVLYSNNIKETQSQVESHGGKIIKPLFNFPGGYRSHFTEPSGNELAVWSKQA